MKLSNKQAAYSMKDMTRHIDTLARGLDDLLSDTELLLRRYVGIETAGDLEEVLSHLKAAEAKLAPMRNMYKPQG